MFKVIAVPEDDSSITRFVPRVSSRDEFCGVVPPIRDMDEFLAERLETVEALFSGEKPKKRGLPMDQKSQKRKRKSEVSKGRDQGKKSSDKKEPNYLKQTDASQRRGGSPRRMASSDSLPGWK